jgi:5-methylcytosine-specific restriction endonuclease McrA
VLVSKNRSMSSSRRHKKVSLLIKRDGDVCWYCERPFADPMVRRTIDHRMPLVLGGDNSLDNLVLACYECNQRKGTALPFTRGSLRTMYERDE